MTIKPFLIGFTGKMEAGKTTAADYLVNGHRFIKSSFAAPLKQAASIIFNLGEEEFITGKEVIDPFWGITRREMLQKLGTDAIRTVFGYDFWTRRQSSFLLENRNSNIVFDDVRFKEEADWITSHGGVVIRVIRLIDTPKYSSGELTHSSETQDIPYSITLVNSGLLEDFYLTLGEAIPRLLLLEELKRPCIGGTNHDHV
jgi:hypothetical protein